MENFDSDKFRKVLGHFPTGVTVITAAAPQEEGGSKPAGFSVGSFASVSLDPPLVMFCAGNASQSWPEIKSAGHFCVNVLSDAQSEISNLFASKNVDKFENLKWRAAKSGAPVLEGAICWIDCEISDIYAAGDHQIVVGRVLDLDIDEAVVKNQGPLIFYKGAYGT